MRYDRDLSRDIQIIFEGESPHTDTDTEGIEMPRSLCSYPYIVESGVAA